MSNHPQDHEMSANAEPERAHPAADTECRNITAPTGTRAVPARTQRMICYIVLGVLIAMNGLLGIAAKTPSPYVMDFYVPAFFGLGVLTVGSLVVASGPWLSGFPRFFVGAIGLTGGLSCLLAEPIMGVVGDLVTLD
jgi:hypothetical protein